MVWQTEQRKQKTKAPSMWSQIITIVLGLWLMIAPAIFHHSTIAANMARIFGPLAITFAVVALWEATRLVRWANLPIGLWLIIAPWLLPYQSLTVTVNCMLVGLLLAFLATQKGVINKKYGGGWSVLFE